ncbi:MAG: chalcone isomerase family protein [Desulfamplus sp.]|nr:chalcone isomerase family protein [Desulfamplus sp.]MBF0411185.1 chalcone isomerase family protein [Desulfamplus sp.]
MLRKIIVRNGLSVELIAIIALLFIFTASIPVVVQAAEDAKSPEKLTLDGGAGEIVLNGTGTRKKFGFKVYEGALYLKAKTTDSKKIIESDEPMAITMSWKRQGPIDKTTDVFSEGFKYGAGANYAAQKANIDTFIKSLIKAEKQDVWKYVYIPGQGTTISYNNKVAATITGLDFKKALFSIWLLEDASFTGDADLRKGMLGK